MNTVCLTKRDQKVDSVFGKMRLISIPLALKAVGDSAIVNPSVCMYVGVCVCMYMFQFG